MLDWLIDWIVFYAVSAIFQPFNGGRCCYREMLNMSFKNKMKTFLLLFWIAGNGMLWLYQLTPLKWRHQFSNRNHQNPNPTYLCCFLDGGYVEWILFYDLSQRDATGRHEEPSWLIDKEIIISIESNLRVNMLPGCWQTPYTISFFH